MGGSPTEVKVEHVWVFEVLESDRREDGAVPVQDAAEVDGLAFVLQGEVACLGWVGGWVSGWVGGWVGGRASLPLRFP